MRTARGALDQGVQPLDERQTVGSFLTVWLTSARTELRPRTATRYGELVRHAEQIAKEKLARLQPAKIRSLYAKKLDEGLAPRTVGHIHRVLHRAFRQAVDDGLLYRNPCDAAHPPKAPRIEMRVLNAQEARRFLEAASDDPLEALYVLAITTGMRQGELLALRWQDIDLDAGIVQVQRSVSRVRLGGFVEGEPKSARSRRQIILTPVAIAALRRHWARQMDARLASDKLPGAAALVFQNGLGGYLEAQNVQRRSFKPLLRRAGLPDIRFHDLRHSAATLLLSLGTNPKIVQELLGHSSIALTLDTYSHVLPGLQKEAVGRLDTLLARVQ